MFWIIADLHLSEKDEKEAILFHEFLEEFDKSEAGTLVILGDLFTHWIATEKGTTSFQRKILEKLTKIKKEKIFLIGNRDYFVEDIEESPFSFAGKKFKFRLPSSKIVLFEHGETINESDRNYLVWSSFTRSQAVKSLLNILPQRILQNLAKKAEKDLSETNIDYKSQIPFEHLKKYAALQSEEGVNTIVLGHFHKRMSLEFEKTRIEIIDKFFPKGFFCTMDEEGNLMDRTLLSRII